MAIVNLGTFDLAVGGGVETYGSLAYRFNRAYALYLTFTSDNFPALFSYVRIFPYIKPNGGLPRLLSHHTDVQITPEPQVFLFPCSRLFDADGDADFKVKRMSYIRTTGDRPTVNLTMTYDDNIEEPTWL